MPPCYRLAVSSATAGTGGGGHGFAPGPDAGGAGGRPGGGGPPALARPMVRAALAALGRATPEQSPTLEVVAGPAKGRVIELPVPGREVVIGRGETCDVAIVDPDLSREQVRVRRDWAGAAVVDLGSKNGTFVGEERLVTGRAPRRGRAG